MTRREFIQQLPEPYLTIANWEIDRLEKELGEKYEWHLKLKTIPDMDLVLFSSIAKWLPFSNISVVDWWRFVGRAYDECRNYPPIHEHYQTLIK